MHLIGLRHRDPMLGWSNRVHTDGAVRCSSLMQRKAVKVSPLIPFSLSLNNTGSCFLLNRLRRPDFLRRLAPSLTPVLWSLQTFKSCHPVKTPGHLFLKQGSKCRVSPIPPPLQVSPAMRGEAEPVGVTAFPLPHQHLPSCSTESKHQGCCRRRGRKIK